MPDWLVEFLAVGLGVYLALWAQRHIDRGRERRREESYLRSLLEDLDRDLAEISSMAGRIEGYAESVRQVLRVLDGSDEIKDTAHLIRLLSATRFMERFRPTTTTMDELTASGGLRVIQAREKVRAVLTYHRRVEDHYLTYHFLWRKMIDRLSPMLKEAAGPAHFPGAMAQLYDVDFALADPYGEQHAGFIEGPRSEDSVGPDPAGRQLLEGIRSHPRLRDEVLDQLETLVVLRGELKVCESLAQAARDVVADG